MIYLFMILIFIVVLSSFLPYNKNRSTLLLFFVLCFYFLSLSTFILYLAKDPQYFSVFLKYFPIPRKLFNRLILLNISKIAIIRMLNLFCIVFIYLNIMFCTSFVRNCYKTSCRKVSFFVASVLIFQYLLYDPKFYISVYNLLYPQFLDGHTIETASTRLCKITLYTNISILLSCIVFMAYRTIKTPNVKLIRYNILCLTVIYALLITSYLFILSWAPTLLIKYSSVADFIRYRSINLNNNFNLYAIFPYVAIILFISSAIAIYAYNHTKEKLHNNNLEISRNIDAVNIASRTFCHYMKNELIALSSEIEELPTNSENEEVVLRLLEHCENLNNRLSELHKKTRENTMNLRKIPIDMPILNAIENVRNHGLLDNIDVRINIPNEVPLALIDPEYFEEALINMIFNSAEAILKADKPTKKIELSVHEDNKWIFIIITDNGIGIKSENLVNIFTPFYSSNPAKKNWGIGLSLAYKIVTACDGKINVKSRENIGTSIDILLPNVFFD